MSDWSRWWDSHRDRRAEAVEAARHGTEPPGENLDRTGVRRGLEYGVVTGLAPVLTITASRIRSIDARSVVLELDASSGPPFTVHIPFGRVDAVQYPLERQTEELRRRVQES